MVLKDRHYLIYLMRRDGVSTRRLAREVGWKTHTYVLRLVSGEARTLKVEPAVRIAEFFGEPVDRLFTPRVSREPGGTVPAQAKVAA